MQRSSLSHILSGRNKPSLDFILRVLQAFPDIDEKWLLHGTKRSEKRSDISVQDDANVTNVSSNTENVAPVSPDEHNALISRSLDKKSGKHVSR